jgi:hypothetical protein
MYQIHENKKDDPQIAEEYLLGKSIDQNVDLKKELD